MIIAAVIVAGAVAAVLLLPKPATKTVDSFQACKNAGGQVLESYPEQCTYQGKSFVNPAQAERSIDSYIGLSEAEAMSLAERSNKPHRVVERDGVSLPADMSFVEGRLNFYVKDGKVTNVRFDG